MPAPSCFTPSQLESISQILADTDSGLTGSEIARLLQRTKIEDVDPGNTKWKRLCNALGVRQNQDRTGDRDAGLSSRSRWTQFAIEVIAGCSERASQI